MTRGERRLRIDTSLLGLALTLLVVALEIGGVLEPLERFFYDYRVRHCQYFTPPPTDKLVHLDVDDPSLASIGRWPWPRNVHAEILDELRLAGCKTVCYDVIFPEPEPIAYRPAPATQPATLPATMPAILPSTGDTWDGRDDTIPARPIDNDGLFAASLSRYGRAVVPVALALGESRSRSAVYSELLALLYANPELTMGQAVERVVLKKVGGAGAEAEVRASFISARRDAMFNRIEDEMRRGAKDERDLQARILPRLGENVGGTPQLNLLRVQYERYRAVRSLHRFGKPPQDGLPLYGSRNEQATIWRLTEPALGSGYVDYVPLSDGVVRIVPLVAEHRGRIIPQMGLALACAALDVKFEDVMLEPNRIVIPRAASAGGDIAIPVRSHRTAHGRYPMFFDIPWFGTSDWETMYDYPARQRKAQHVSLSFVWEVREFLSRIERNNANIDDALGFLLDMLYADKPAKAYFARRAPLDDTEARAPVVEKVVAEVKDSIWTGLLTMKPEELLEDERLFVNAYTALVNAQRHVKDLKQLVEARRADLRSRLQDKAALIGYIAIAQVADNVPTSLHPRCPGVVVHGVVFNAIMTGDFWRATAPWVSVVLTVVLGSLTTVIVVSLTPWRALAGAGVLAGGYLLYNGLYFFDYRNLIVEVAGPVTAIGAVWAGGTFARYLLEAYERARVKQRFEHYVDPTLVEHVLETDDPMDGVKKELTVVFTDLQGFTTLAEALGEKTVGMLNEYMSLMVPVIRKHHGYLNKYLGDGIMYFFGAPRPNADHAYDAVASVLEMQEVMVEFNKGLVERNLPTLITRAGISAGEMIVGDAGSAQFGSDYTVLGDAVNLGARLESANKFFGTKILLNERARTMVGDRVLTRPVGKLQVVGKKEGVMTFEAMALAAKATEKQKELARLTTEMVTAYIGGKFEKCMGFVEEIERGFGTTKLTELYRSMCEQNLVEVPSDFSGQIVLTAK